MGQNLSVSDMSQVDHGCYKSYKYTYRWDISNFKNLASKGVRKHSRTMSPYLTLNVQDKAYTFNLILYAYGYNERVKDYLSIFLKKDSTDEMLIKFTCAVVDKNDKLINEKCIKKKLSLESHLGWLTYCRRDFLLNSEIELPDDGNLVLNCTLEIFENRAIMNAETEYSDPCMKKLQSKLSDDLNHLHVKEDFSDFTLTVEGKNFPVHRAILSARSDVFKAMLKSELQTDSNELNIDDMKAETVREMLHYIYSGNVAHTDIQTAKELYYAADKYVLSDLKNVCHKILVHNLDASNAIDVLLIGYKHSDTELEFASIKFIAKNASKIQEKKEWVDLMKNYPQLANMVFELLAKKS